MAGRKERNVASKTISSKADQTGKTGKTGKIESAGKMNNGSIISVDGLSKTYQVKEHKGFLKDLFSPSYRYIHAVKGISFEIGEAEIVGFIGPNGAGKTTTIKMLVGILWPDSGRISANGLIPHKHRKQYLMNIGVVFGQRKSLWPELSVKDNLELISSFYKTTKEQFARRLAELNRLIPLDGFINQSFRKLSLGQQMKAELVASLLHTPQILLLDEPTIGMDVVAKLNFINLLKGINRKERTTILLTSHDLHEIENLCHRIIVINDGNILYDGDINKVKPNRVTVKYEAKGRMLTREVEKKDLKEFLKNIDLTEASINEIPLEHVIKKFYRQQ